jgi:hypothetical protein
MRQLSLANQFLKKSAVMDHRLAQVFGAGLTLSLTERDIVGRTVILKDHRVVHRDICRPVITTCAPSSTKRLLLYFQLLIFQSTRR